MGGELVDARRDDPRWADPETDDSDWYPVTEVAAPAIPAEAQKCPPMRVLKTIPAISCTKLADGKYQLDFGTQLTGWLKLRVRGQAAGHTITIEYADKLEPLQTFKQIDRFICAGEPEEEFCSKFNYHGFRWAIMEGLATAPELADAEAQLIGADFETRGGFECSSEQLNRMHAGEPVDHPVSEPKRIPVGLSASGTPGLRRRAGVHRELHDEFHDAAILRQMVHRLV